MPANIPVTHKPRIVVAGGGFAGLKFIKYLQTSDVQIVLIDKNNYHTFQPLLYQVATAGLEPDSIAAPFREIFSKRSNFIFRMAEIRQINPEKNTVETSIGDIKYDYLVIATGSQTNFFGMSDVKGNAMPMKTIPDALNLRSFVLQNFEEALLLEDKDDLEASMHFVIVGGGPTGVELAGALAELEKIVLPLDYPELDISRMKIVIVEMQERLLPAMSVTSSVKAAGFLKDLGVELFIDTTVTAYDGKVIRWLNKIDHLETERR